MFCESQFVEIVNCGLLAECLFLLFGICGLKIVLLLFCFLSGSFLAAELAWSNE